MGQKRCRSEDGDGFRCRGTESKNGPLSSTHFMHGLSSRELASRLEPFFRDVIFSVNSQVQEEVERALRAFASSSNQGSFPPYQIEPSRARTLQLHFRSKLPSTLFTECKVESEENNPIELALLDATSGEIVAFGPLSSVKVEVLPLDGDFNADDGVDWTEKDFERKIAHEREGKKPLLTGDRSLRLKGGVGYLGVVVFTDNSSWTRSRRFRLGARVVDSSDGVKVKEAVSEAFVVKDHRGDSYKKHHPPSLDDDIWRLENIGKNGKFHKRLESYRILTVKDFLQLYVVDPSSLRCILGGGTSNRVWEAITKNANECVLDDKVYLYQSENVGLLFNSIFQVVGATFDGQSYKALDEINPFQMRLVEETKRLTYETLILSLPVDASCLFGVPALFPNSQNIPSSSFDWKNVIFPVPAQDLHQSHEGSSSMTMPSPNPYYTEGSGSVPRVGSLDSVSRTAWQPVNDPFLVEAPPWNSNELCIPPVICGAECVAVDSFPRFSRIALPKGRWFLIWVVMVWVSMRRKVAARRLSRLQPYFDFST